MRPKFQKQSVLKLAGRIIPYKQGYNTPQLVAESVSKSCFGVHTRDIDKPNLLKAFQPREDQTH